MAKIIFTCNYLEILRDFINYFPKEELSNPGKWQWQIDEYSRLHMIQVPYWPYGATNLRAILDVEFQGDGVSIFTVRSDGTDGATIARGMYDDHCLDNGRKFRRLFETMDPRSELFLLKIKESALTYYEAYWNQDVIGDPEHAVKPELIEIY